MFIKYPHKTRTVPIRVFIPNMITTGSLVCGLASMHFSLKADWDRAMFAVLLAAIFDGLDGRAARMLKVTSPFGEILDSLADFLSFGVAPAMLLHQWLLKDHEFFGLLTVATFVLCSAMRLARFTAAAKYAKPASGPPSNEELREHVVKSKFFVGLATPAAAAAVLVPPMLVWSKYVGPVLRPLLGYGPMDRLDSASGPVDSGLVWGVMLYVLLISFMMISRIPMFSFKRLRVSRRAGVPILVMLGLLGVLAAKDIWLLVPALALAYLLSFPLSVMSHRKVLGRPAIASKLEAK